MEGGRIAKAAEAVYMLGSLKQYDPYHKNLNIRYPRFSETPMYFASLGVSLRPVLAPAMQSLDSDGGGMPKDSKPHY